MASLIICSAAETDYTESLCWYAERSPNTAREFDGEFDRALKEILSDPTRFPLCDARHHYFLMRRFPFRIIYRFADDEVIIIAVAHAARSPDFWADR